MSNRSNDIIDIEPNQRAENLKAIGWVSYILHLIVAVAAVVPSAQPSMVSPASVANLRGPILYARPASIQKK